MNNSLISRISKKVPKVWIISFVLSFFFFASAIPITFISAVSREESAGLLYLANECKDGEAVCGFLTNLSDGLYRNLAGIRKSTAESESTGIYEYEGGLIGSISEISDTLYETPTASAIIWAQDQMNLIAGKGRFESFAYNANDTDQYYISGYTALEPIIGMWNWSKNIVYGVFIIILIVVAFMILFRQQLGGQQYVTLTNSLPSIILSLVLITFSYPISALFIDIVSIGSNIGYNLIINSPDSPGSILTSPDFITPKAAEAQIELEDGTFMAGFEWDEEGTQLKNVLQPDDPQMSLWSIFYTSNAKICGEAPLFFKDFNFVDYTPNIEKCEFSRYTAPAAINGVFGSSFNGLLSAIDQLGLPNAFLTLIIVLIILSTQFKLFKIIIEAYLILSFFPIIAPWIFLIAAIPNRTQKVISDYLKIMGGAAFNLVVIYICFLILIVLGYSTSVKLGNESTSNPELLELSSSFRGVAELKWVPPMLGYSHGQIIGNEGLTGSNEKIIATLVILMLYLSIPRIPDEIRAWLEIPELPPILKGTAQDFGQKTKEAAQTTAAGIGKIKNFSLGPGKG